MRVESDQIRSKWTSIKWTATHKRTTLKWLSISNVVYAALTLMALVMFMQDAQASILLQ